LRRGSGTSCPTPRHITEGARASSRAHIARRARGVAQPRSVRVARNRSL
jgi:hypothetical protein